MKLILQKVIQRLSDQAKKDGIQKIVLGAIILDGNKDRALCVLRHPEDFMPGLWELPSGNKDKGESIEDGLYRETKEETGLDIAEIVDYAGSFDYTSGSGKKARQFSFVVSVNPGSVVLEPKEHIGYAWLSLPELDKYNISNETKAQIKAALLTAKKSISLIEMEQGAYDRGIDRCVVAGIAKQNDKVLIVKRASDDFMGGIDELPSGKVDAGETFSQALVREMSEETGLTVTGIGRLVGTFDYSSKSGKKTRQFTFEINTTGNVSLSEEHEGYAWASQAEIKEKRYNLSDQTANHIMTFFTNNKRSASDLSVFNKEGEKPETRSAKKARV